MGSYGASQELLALWFFKARAIHLKNLGLAVSLVTGSGFCLPMKKKRLTKLSLCIQ